MTDARVLNSVQKDARSRFKKLLDVLENKEINRVPHIFISKIKAPPHRDAKGKNGGDLVKCFLIRAQSPTGSHARKDRYETAVHEAFVQIVKEEIGKLAHDHRSQLGCTLSRRNFQKIRLQIVRMSMQRLETDALVESVLLPL